MPSKQPHHSGNPIEEYDIYDDRSVISHIKNTRSTAPNRAPQNNEPTSSSIPPGQNGFDLGFSPNNPNIIKTPQESQSQYRRNGRHNSRYQSNAPVSIPARRQDTTDATNLNYSEYSTERASSSGTKSTNIRSNAAEKSAWFDRTMIKLGSLISPPKITSQYSNFKIPEFSDRLPFLFRNFCAVIVFVVILIALCASLVIYFALVNQNNCFGNCKSAGELGLFLNGFGKASSLEPNEASDPQPNCDQYTQGLSYYVLLNSAQFGSYDSPKDSPVCGKCMFISGPKTVLRAMIVGSCSNCTFGSIQLSQPAFDFLKPNSRNDPFPVSWGPC
ncbi:hypothetical protein BB561_003782 [Smittium simulii]|uniref:RlpA-like protein double-psi beta-barrel domain-containing protein n=1 Tax=Smittium simulii TaxID=133385 RepID=A0A2T9YJF4_9FUNG|nr:hypothetical protein BB561_003782 [Smittium simulii]